MVFWLEGKNGVQGEPTGIGDQLMVNGTPGPREGRATGPPGQFMFMNMTPRSSS
jgi:hypothetical protein